ncbi:hypothetical protein XBO1_2250051 [Xenorhabdus bovienii str. oregonense]|uniref:Uncharacterized protein n=1 Tax=Xenorhabdus bovienii str. oregonense TaxID=1398202 RepID=A0A077P5G6_XENBV|nr:hypothetical protein XBO1_2250051 [Xenorhabdus bovienii str. oregonense]
MVLKFDDYNKVFSGKSWGLGSLGIGEYWGVYMMRIWIVLMLRQLNVGSTHCQLLQQLYFMMIIIIIWEIL